VEFDESLNKAVQKLRQAMGDSSDNPHLIETVPRRGYRFIAAVEPVGQDMPELGAPSSKTDHWLTRERILWIAALAVSMVVILTIWIRWPAPVPARLRKYSLEPAGGFADPVISPDGQQIAYTAEGSAKQTDQAAGSPSVTRLWIQDLKREEPREIAGTEGAHAAPFWSPDSTFVGFAVKKQLWKAPVQGGSPSPVCDISDALLGGTWSLDGRNIIFSIHHQGIYEVPAGGGIAKILIPVDRSAAGDHFDDPYLLPTAGGERNLLYSAQRIGAVHDIVLHSLKSGTKTVLAQDAFHPVYSTSGHILYWQTSGALGVRALPFSLATMTATGEAFTIAPNGQQPSAARDGTLVYWVEGSWPRIQLTWHDRRGNKIAAIGPPEPIETMSVSPDGRSVALNLIGDEGKPGIWVLDVTRGTKIRLTFSLQADINDINPVWLPSGKEIAFSSNRLGHMDIYTASVGISGDVHVLAASRLHKRPNDWSPDGRFLVYEVEDPKTGRDLWYLSPKQGGGYESTPFLRTPAYEGAARFSPDRHFLAYVSTESGRPEVYVRHFPDGSGIRRISVDGGRLPAWRKDGKELFYLEGETLVSVEVATGPVLSIGEMRRLFKSSGLTNVQLSAGYYAEAMYGVSPSGERFLFPELTGQVGKPAVHIVDNWFEEFRNRASGIPYLAKLQHACRHSSDGSPVFCNSGRCGTSSLGRGPRAESSPSVESHSERLWRMTACRWLEQPLMKAKTTTTSFGSDRYR
jgi:Tol biopolymer transport system component